MARAWPRFALSLRVVALLACGSVLVHELRYVLGYGHHADEALAAHGHSYMPLAKALVAVLLAGALARLAVALWKAWRGYRPAPARPRFAALWLRATLTLAGVYILQEGFEGAFAPGHPDGVVGVVGNGGWTALVLSVLVGALIALAARGADRLIRLVARRAAGARLKVRGTATLPPRRPAGPRLDVLACNLAGRAPPLPL